MNSSAEPATFYIVPTPIGNLADITLRALTILKTVDFIAAEDTRQSQHLLHEHGISTPMISLHQHNEQQRSREILTRLASGQSGALISDAGTPLISDPGGVLLPILINAGVKIVPLPGACAFITALSASGLDPTKFLFAGFLPTQAGKRERELKVLQQQAATLIFYEAPHRLNDSLQSFLSVFGAEHTIVVARELTKKFEQFYRGTIQNVIDHFIATPAELRGEIVILIEGCAPQTLIDERTREMLTILCEAMPPSQAVNILARLVNVNKNALYPLIIEN